MRAFTLAIIFSLLALTNAQFQFFEQMFNGGQQQQQQQPQNVASDSAWYQQTYESGRLPFPISIHLPNRLPIRPLVRMMG